MPVTATDADGDPLIYWADNLPPGATFTPDTHTFAWTPAIGAAGTYPGVTMYVSDGTATVSQSFDVLGRPRQSSAGADVAARPHRAPGRRLRSLLRRQRPRRRQGHSTPAATCPTGAVLDANTGRFQWTVPATTCPAPFAVPITVTSSNRPDDHQDDHLHRVVARRVAPVFDPQTGLDRRRGAKPDVHKRSPSTRTIPTSCCRRATPTARSIRRRRLADHLLGHRFAAGATLRCSDRHFLLGAGLHPGRAVHRSPSPPPTAADDTRPCRRRSPFRSRCATSTGRRRSRRSATSASTAARCSTCR